LPVLAQEYIGGKGSAAKTLTLYFDRHGRLALRAAARILLEEQTPRGKGNYAAAVTCPIPRVAEPLSKMLTAIGYRGFANFDLRCDADGQEYVLEINLRQGRSNYHLTAAGCNPAALLYRDLILEEPLSPQDAKEEVLYHTAPLSLLYHYTESDEDARLLRRLWAAGKTASPFYAPTDFFHDPIRFAYVAAHMYRQREKFRRYAVRYR
jgi:D-aspartate ligase